MSTLIGLTGGIACGKSSVSKYLLKKGAIVVDADQIARNILAPNSLGLERVLERWGQKVLNVNGQVNRAYLGSIVFSDPKERKALEAITHPLIAQESQSQIEDARSKKVPLIVYDAALLIEAGRSEQFRPLVVVTTSEEIQKKRIMDRDHLTEADALARIDSQLPLKDKEKLADYLIYNDGNWAKLYQQVDELWQCYVVKLQ